MLLQNLKIKDGNFTKTIYFMVCETNQLHIYNYELKILLYKNVT